MVDGCLQGAVVGVELIELLPALANDAALLLDFTDLTVNEEIVLNRTAQEG